MKPMRDLVVVRAAAPAALLTPASTGGLDLLEAVSPGVEPPDARDAEQEPAEVREQPQSTDDEASDDPAAPIARMTVRFAPYGTWYEVNSWYEGHFLERVMPGAFTKTMVGRKGVIKSLFDHGMDLYIGDKPIGPIDVLEDRPDSPYAEVPVLDTSYNRDLVPGLAAGVYGSSFMFRVIQDMWNDEPDPSDHNPKGIPERSITEVKLLEFGPVTWPANPAATAGLRSGTDWFAERLRNRRPDRFEVLTQQFSDFRAQHGLRTPADDEAARAGNADTSPVDFGAADDPTDAPDSANEHHATGLSSSARARLLAAPFLMGANQ